MSFNTISSAQARMLFIFPTQRSISLAFSSSVTPCFLAISFIRYSAISRVEVSISARYSYNFPLVSRLKYSTRLRSLKYRCRNRSILEGLSKIKFWSRILSHTVKELFRSFLYKKSRKPLKTKAFGVVSWRRKRDLNPRPHA